MEEELIGFMVYAMITFVLCVAVFNSPEDDL